MIVSTKGRNALKLMMCLAQVDDHSYTPLKVISAQQNISLKYLESITSMLSKQKFVEAASGKGGGYRLSRPPEEYSVGEILRAVEESIEPVKCIENGTPICETADSLPHPSDLERAFCTDKQLSEFHYPCRCGKL